MAGVRGLGPERALLDRAVAELNRRRPAFAVVCGDLVQTVPPLLLWASPSHKLLKLSLHIKCSLFPRVVRGKFFEHLSAQRSEWD